ncbi:MAG: M14 family zinc carboxypeptidase [Gilvibacter sp.]
MPLVPSHLKDRYLPLDDLLPYLEMFDKHCKIKVMFVGKSVLKKDIPVIRIGNGDFKMLCWSQMHGNETTTTKMLLDICHQFYTGKENVSQWTTILERVTLIIVPVLNPDGASLYTRENANEVDLNRDAKQLTQPESLVLRELFDAEQPDLCLNLHGQRSIYGIKESGKSAAISFLAPAADKEKSLTPARVFAMNLISGMNHLLQTKIPGQVGRYDDTYNGNCVGDTFTSLGCPVILFEAGQLALDYDRNNTRTLLNQVFIALLRHLSGIDTFADSTPKDYFDIPENVVFYDDILIKNVLFPPFKEVINIRAHYKEVLKDRHIRFIPEAVEYGEGITGTAHQIIDCQNNPVDDSTINTSDLVDYVTEYLLKNFSR